MLIPVVNLEFLFREQVQLCSKEPQLQPNKLKIEFFSIRLKVVSFDWLEPGNVTPGYSIDGL